MSNFKFTLNLQIKLVQFINFCATIFGIWYLTQIENWVSWLVFTQVMSVIIAVIGGNVVLHRMVSHKSFKTWPWLEKVLLIISVYTTIGSPLSFSAFHRYHHAHSDKDDDNHSPYVHQPDGTRKFSAWKGFKIAIGVWGQPYISPRYVVDLARDPYIRFLHQHYFKILLLPLLILALINPLLVVYGYCWPMIQGLIGSQFGLTVVTHRHGYRTYNTSDESRNTWIGWLIAGGEGWHNNHHANPGNYRHGEKWWEFDPSGRIIEWIKTSDRQSTNKKQRKPSVPISEHDLY